MSYINNVSLLGNVGNNPEFRTTQDGRTVCTFSLATNESYKDDTGEWKQNTSWHKVVIYNQIAVKYAEKTLNKGDKVFIQGMLHTRKWTDSDGKDKYMTEVVVKNYSGHVLTGKEFTQDNNNYYETDGEF